MKGKPGKVEKPKDLKKSMKKEAKRKRRNCSVLNFN